MEEDVDSDGDICYVKKIKMSESTVAHGKEESLRESGKASGDIVEELAAGFENDFGELTSKRGRKHDQGTGQGRPPKRLRAFHGTVPEDEDDQMNRRRPPPPADDDDKKEMQKISTKLRKADDFADTLKIRLKGVKLASSIVQESNTLKPEIINLKKIIIQKLAKEDGCKDAKSLKNKAVLYHYLVHLVMLITYHGTNAKNGGRRRFWKKHE